MRPPFAVILLLFFFSGVSALIYEVLWLKELGLLFGNASYAMATTLAAFFAGLAVGGYHWGKRVGVHDNPLKLYGLLELGVAVCALGYFFILHGYAFFYPQLFAWFGLQRLLFVVVKFFLAMVILFPPAWFMGGTLPVISHYAVRQSNQLGHQVSLLYICNTLGAVVGVFLAGFYLPVLLGFKNSYLLAMSITVLVAVAAVMFARKPQKPMLTHKAAQLTTGKDFFALKLLAFLSGLLMLALQVLWGRMFAQVLQNSVYTFSMILIVFLFALAMGGVLANRLMRVRHDRHLILFLLLCGGALLVAITPFEFIWLTDNLHYTGSDENWKTYLFQVMIQAIIIMGPPLLLLGCVFPFLIKLSEKNNFTAGIAVGHLAAINTTGAITGSLLAGFVILDYMGLWAGIRLMAVVYILTAWLWLENSRKERTKIALLPALAIFLFVSVLDTSKLAVVKVDPVIDEESLLEVWEGSSGTVAVIRRADQLKLKVNNYYTLGGTGSFGLERFQGSLPVLLHKKPQSVYVLGMGTGISAGAVLSFPIEKLVVSELIPEVVTAADKYFGRYTNRLFYDPRVTIIKEDGRNYLRGTNEYFDVIISDLFVPWKAGVGNLYSLEHYETIKKHLHGSGVFMQWLPAYQLSKTEFDIIARTMLEVFPQITVWRGDFSALKPIIGLLGHKSIEPLSINAWIFKRQNKTAEKAPILAHYVGDMGLLRSQLTDVRLNTDDRPVIEFQAPITQRRTKSGEVKWFTGNQLIAFMRRFIVAGDAFYLSELDKYRQRLPHAGYHLHRARILRYQGKLTLVKKEMAMYRELVRR